MLPTGRMPEGGLQRLGSKKGGTRAPRVRFSVRNHRDSGWTVSSPFLRVFAAWPSELTTSDRDRASTREPECVSPSERASGHPLLKALAGRAREIRPGALVLALLCAAYYAFGLPH
jgi:hypothetical protein